MITNTEMDPQMNNAQRVRDIGALGPQLDVFIIPFPSRLMELCGMEGKNILRARGGGQLQENSVLQTQQCRCTYIRTCP